MSVRLLPALIVLVGLSTVAFGQVADADPTRYFVTVGDPVESETDAVSAAVVDVDDRDPAVREAVQESLTYGARADLDTTPDSVPEYVRHEGQVHPVETSGVTGDPVLKPVTTAIGSLVVVCGLLVWVANRLDGEIGDETAGPGTSGR